MTTSLPLSSWYWNCFIVLLFYWFYLPVLASSCFSDVSTRAFTCAPRSPHECWRIRQWGCWGHVWWPPPLQTFSSESQTSSFLQPPPRSLRVQTCPSLTRHAAVDGLHPWDLVWLLRERGGAQTCPPSLFHHHSLRRLSHSQKCENNCVHVNTTGPLHV